ncbi:MAG: DUF86 domain-containing protein [Deltaproteobacteria bacterium]|nr:DUF86 domain-containing protein [Deltaproteobacteria bacterium]
MRDDSERLRDILESIERIERYTEQGRGAFDRDELIQIWVVHHIQIIGEAAARVSENFKVTHPGVPWAQVVAMRNVLVHQYFGIDPDEVWAAVERDLPELKTQLTQILTLL